jgi:hypothetical protein
MSSSSVKETFLSPLVVGSIAAIASYALGINGTVSVLGATDIPLHLWLGGVTFVASASGQTIKQYVLPLSLSQSDSQMVSALTMPAIVGASNALLMYVLSGDLVGTGFLLGAGSQISGQYVYDNILKQYVSPSYSVI